ncbi:MAG: hypothetical protein LRY41_02965 [Candidatus Pacebacteria bacterium]|nr:hypothetical protein [Candidatus Paceibacterota bacterium]MCD8507905.1 hypothetical protein [Candidatus Paceibacterota bacterium]MCD8528258.1 hypothetical protein [Candidatus Paceibacterota bacterium]MCD8563948.1 hypothetical protein [Candidatus Paceibacterota bacterium]
MDLSSQDKQDLLRALYATQEETIRHLQFHTKLMHEYHEKIEDMWYAALEKMQEEKDRMLVS